jgi:hypothetical protein
VARRLSWQTLCMGSYPDIHQKSKIGDKSQGVTKTI